MPRELEILIQNNSFSKIKVAVFERLILFDKKKMEHTNRKRRKWKKMTISPEKIEQVMQITSY